jgi:methyl-accepting chemotaxis protein
MMDKIRHFLANVPFTIKFAIAPSVAVVALIGLDFFASSALHSSAGDTAYIVERNMLGSNLLAEVNVDAQRLNAHLYRLLTDQAMSPLGKALPDRVAAIKSEEAKLAEKLTSYRDKFADAQQKPEIEKALKQLDDLKGGLDVVASMLEISFNSAASFADPFQAIFDQVASTTSAIQATALADSQKRSAATVGEARSLGTVLLLAMVAIAAAIGAISLLIGRITTRSIVAIAHVTTELSRNNLNVDIDSLSRRDELSAIVESLKGFASGIGEREQMRLQQETQKQQAEAERRTTLLRLADDFQANVGSTVQKVANASDGMTGSAKEMSAIAERNTAQARESSESASHASMNIQTVAAAAEELSASISEISRQVIHAKETAQKAGEKANLTTSIVHTLSQAVNSIGQVVQMINDIAGQTNLLALNATIEAARAGEAGKGFAVVANEVKHLATQTARATGDIGGQIGAVQEATRQAVAAIEEIVQTIANITDVSMVIAAAVEEQQASTSEIVRNVSEVSVQTDMLATNIAYVNEAAMDADRVAGQVFDSASGLSGLCGDLRGQVTDFLDRFRNG